MPGRIEKTVFISYRRANIPWALAIYQNLTNQGYDVFFDYLSIKSGDFEQIIIGNIKARAHFIVILTPSALERCNEPRDWLRREIETAIDSQRNIVPLMLESFEFDSLSATKALTGKLEKLKKYNGLRVHSDYFFEGMSKLGTQFLNVSLDTVVHPISEDARHITQEHQTLANEARPVEREQLAAQELLEKGYLLLDSDEYKDAIRYFYKAIHLDPNAPMRFFKRSKTYFDGYNLEKPQSDLEISYEPNLMDSIATTIQDDPEVLLIQKEQLNEMKDLLTRMLTNINLSDIESKILFLDTRDYTDREIATLINTPEYKVLSIRSKVMRRLRNYINRTIHKSQKEK